MGHVTFIHGIGNKPEAGALHKIWLRALAREGLDLGESGVSSSMVYWADVLYDKPVTDAQAFERASEEGELRAEMENADFGAPSAKETAFVAVLAMKVGAKLSSVLPDETAQKSTDNKFERIPLPWPLKEAFLKHFLKDTHHYLFNTKFSPRPGVSYRVQDEIRARFTKAIADVPKDAGRHVVVSHSMGTVIAYDCLKRVGECPAVDSLVTIGSPLGLDEIQDRLKPGWTRQDGFPSGKLAANRWLNVFDHLDPVCGLDPKLANDFQASGQGRVEDLPVSNDGRWRHAIAKYLAQPMVVKKLSDLLDL